MPTRRVLITRRIPPPAVELFTKAGIAVDLLDQDEPPGRATLLARLRGVAGLIAMQIGRAHV